LWQKQNKESKTLDFLIVSLGWLRGNVSTSGMETVVEILVGATVVDDSECL